MAHVDPRDGVADDVFGQASPDDLDLGQLRHETRRYSACVCDWADCSD